MPITNGNISKQRNGGSTYTEFLLFLAKLYALHPLLYYKGARAAGAFRFIGHRDNRIYIGLARVRNPLLGAVKNVIIAILAGGEKVANADRKAVAIQGVVTKLRLAMIHGRSIKLHLKDQTLVEGAVSAIRHSVEMNVTLEGERGSVVIPIGMVSEVSGVDDLLHTDYLMAA